MPDCPTPNQLCQYLNDALSVGENAALEAHVETCPHCQEKQARLADVPPCPDVPDHDIEGLLDVGGMSVVWRARHRHLGRPAAVKVFFPHALAAPGQRARLFAEAKALATLNHPSIVAIYDGGADANPPYLVLELIEGCDLKKKLNGRPLQPRQAAELLLTVSRAVGALHARGIVHRDLTPSNILLEGERSAPIEKCKPRLIDLGISKQLDAPAGLTRTMEFVGTASYAAPEQANGGAITPATDVYGLGATLYEVLTGRPPFLADTFANTLALVQNEDPISPRRLNPVVPRDLETICLKCLEKEPAQRYPNAKALATDLDCFLQGKPIVARPVGTSRRLWKWCRRKPVVASMSAAIFMVVVCSLVTITYWWWQTERARRELETNQKTMLSLLTKLFALGENDFHSQSAHSTRLKLLQEVEAGFRHLEPQPGFELSAWRALAQIHRMQAQILFSLGKTTTAESIIRDSCRYWEKLLQFDPTDMPARNDYGKALALAGMLYFLLERKREAIEAYQTAYNSYSLSEPDGENPQKDVDFITTGITLAGWLNGIRQFERARSVAEDSGSRLAHLIELQAFQKDQTSYRRLVGQRAVMNKNWASMVGPLVSESQRRRYLESAHADYQWLLEREPTAGSYFNFADCCLILGSRSNGEGYLSQAIDAAKNAVAMTEQELKSDPENVRVKARLADTYNRLRMIHRMCNQPEQAAQASRQAAEIRRSLADTASEADALVLLASQEAIFSYQLRGADAADEAVIYSEQSVKELQALQMRFPDKANIAYALDCACYENGKNLWAANRTEDALSSFRQSVHAARRSFDLRPSDPEARHQLSDRYGRLAHWTTQVGLRQEAEICLLEVEKLWPDDPQQLQELAGDFQKLADAVGSGPLTDTQKAERQRYLDHASRVLQKAN